MTLKGVFMQYDCWSRLSFQAALICQLYYEKGKPPLTAATLPLVMKDWLFNRGFTDNKLLLELEETAGNLTIAIKAIRTLLSNLYKPKENSRQRPDKAPILPNFVEIQMLFTRVWKKRLQTITPVSA